MYPNKHVDTSPQSTAAHVCQLARTVGNCPHSPSPPTVEGAVLPASTAGLASVDTSPEWQGCGYSAVFDLILKKQPTSSLHHVGAQIPVVEPGCLATLARIFERSPCSAVGKAGLSPCLTHFEPCIWLSPTSVAGRGAWQEQAIYISRKIPLCLRTVGHWWFSTAAFNDRGCNTNAPSS